MFIKLLGGRFVGSTKVNFDIGRQLWCTLSPLFGCKVKQLLPNASTNFQKTFLKVPYQRLRLVCVMFCWFQLLFRMAAIYNGSLSS